MKCSGLPTSERRAPLPAFEVCVKRTRTDTCGRKCPADPAVALIGGRWKIPVLWHLLAGTRRFGELKRALPGCTAKMLTRQLRELESAGVIRRKVYAQVPPKVEYSLTPKGKTLKPVIDAMCRWGK